MQKYYIDVRYACLAIIIIALVNIVLYDLVPDALLSVNFYYIGMASGLIILVLFNKWFDNREKGDRDG